MPFTPITGQKVTAGSMASATSHALTYPLNPTPGSAQVIFFNTDANTALTTPTGFVKLGELGGGPGKAALFARVTQVGDGKTLTVAQTAAGFADMCIDEYSGGVSSSTAALIDLFGSASTAGATHLLTSTSTPNAGVPAQNDELALVVVETGGNDGGVLTWGASGFTTVFDTFGGGFGKKNVNATPAVITADPTWPNNLGTIAIIGTLKALLGEPKVFESGSFQRAPLNAFESGTFTGKRTVLKEFNGTSWAPLQ